METGPSFGKQQKVGKGVNWDESAIIGHEGDL